MSERSCYLHLSDVELLRAWGRDLRRTFGEMPYLVGSALQRPDYRDVDVRIMLDDDKYDMVVKLINPRLLNLALSLWGQKVTGLPIDCQIQQTYSANQDYPGLRDPIGIGAAALDKWTPEALNGDAR